MSSLRAIVINLPGSYGLNTLEDTATDEVLRYCSLAENGVVSAAGKLTSREDFILQTSGGTNVLETCYLHTHSDATETMLSAGSGNIYTGGLSAGALTSRATYTPTTENNWQFASLSGKLFAFQSGVAGGPKAFVEGTWTSQAFTGAPWTSSPNCAIAAYGRMWAADDQDAGNRYTVWWSNLLDGTTWNTGDAGSLSLINAWPKGQDSIVALSAGFSRLIIFGRNSILMYTLPANNDPASMTLTDTVENIGCISRDSVINTDDGIYFLSENGIYRIDKLAQTTSQLTLPQMTKLVTQDIIDLIAAESDWALIKAGYYPKEGWYVLSFPTSNKTVCLHTRKIINVTDSDTAPVVTTWTNVGMPFRSFTHDASGNWYTAADNGIYKYSGYTPDGASQAYNFVYTTQWLNFEDESRLKHLKKVFAVLKAASGQTGTLTWLTDYIAGTSNSISVTADSTEFVEDPGIGTIHANIGRSCSVAKVSLSFPINGDQVTIHQLRINATPGALKW